MTTTPIICDADVSADVGDVGGIATACAYHRLGFVDILAGIVCVTNPHSPGAADAVAHHMGVTIPLWGSYQPGSSFDPNGPGTFAETLYTDYPHPNVAGLSATITEAVDAYETALTGRDGDVVIVAVGPLTTVDALLTALPSLVASAVDRLVVMGGTFPATGTEWNFQQAPAAADRVMDNWPTPVVLLGYEVGNSFTVGNGISDVLTDDDPRRDAYELSSYAVAGRSAWDEMAVLAAAEGHNQFDITRGTCTVDASTGENSWSASPSGNHVYLTKRATDAHYKAHINALLMMEDDLAAWPAGAASLTLRL